MSVGDDGGQSTGGYRWRHVLLGCLIYLVVALVVVVASVWTYRTFDAFLEAQLGVIEARATSWTIALTWVLCQFKEKS